MGGCKQLQHNATPVCQFIQRCGSKRGVSVQVKIMTFVCLNMYLLTVNNHIDTVIMFCDEILTHHAWKVRLFFLNDIITISKQWTLFSSHTCREGVCFLGVNFTEVSVMRAHAVIFFHNSNYNTIVEGDKHLVSQSSVTSCNVALWAISLYLLSEGSV